MTATTATTLTTKAKAMITTCHRMEVFFAVHRLKYFNEEP